MKKIKILIILLMIIIIPFNVSAKNRDIVISFFAKGGKVASGNVELQDDAVFLKDKAVADVKYSYSDKINYLNSLDKKNKFTLKKGNVAQTKKYEWYAQSWSDYKIVYFSNSTKYKVSDIVKKLGIPDSVITSSGNPLEIAMYANYSKVDTKHEVTIIYKTNTGSLDNPHGSGISEKSGTIYKDDTTKIQTVKYGEKTSSTGLVNYNNDDYVNIKKKGYSTKSGKEWNTKPNGKGKNYSQSKVYKSKDLCDASKKDCTVTLYVNWKKSKSKKILASTDKVSVNVGTSKQMTAETDNGTGVTWKIENSNIANVSNGTIKGLNKGKTKVVITSKDNKKVSKKITVSVLKPDEYIAKSDKRVDNSNKTLKKLGTIDLTSYKNNCVHVPSSSGISSAQGFTIAKGHYIAAKRNKHETEVRLLVISVNASKKYDHKTSVTNTITKSKYLGHANGMTYNSNTNKIYITKTTNGKYKTFTNNEVKKNKPGFSEGTIYRYTNANGVSTIDPGGIAYDPSNNKFYIGSGSSVYVYDSTLTNNILHITKARKDTCQDIAGHNGKILVIRYNKGGPVGGSNLKTTRNAVDIYNASSGNYEGTYIIKTKGELESLAYNPSSSKFAFYVQNVKGMDHDYDCIMEKHMKVS